MAASEPHSDPDAGPVYFWRETEEKYGFLSQWYECYFEHDGVTFNTAEMWMMVQKAVLFNDNVGLKSQCLHEV
jgi:predicted NAD-dependent protein-ADP-ribosyltransferase YbiA (DUF1768 family)